MIGPPASPDPTAPCVVIGAGPAGLTAAYELATRAGRKSIVLEADDDVGGLSRTCEYRGYRFDIGGHRFFTKVDYVQELWEEILGDEFLDRPRLSRIHYRGRLFDYPLKPLNALLGLGPVEAVRIGFSYLATMVFPHRHERNFEQWVSNRFGRRLYEIFFKTYTEKVWGIPCQEISAEWAAQRIKNLDLRAAVIHAFIGQRRRRKGEEITTLIERFQYPRHGPGQMWRRCAERLAECGSAVRLGEEVVRIRHDSHRVLSVTTRHRDGTETEVSTPELVSSMPLRDAVLAMDPPPPPAVLEAARRLRYRDFLTVALIVDEPELFPDNWVYIHSSEVRVGRIQNYKNWSPDMVADPARTALGLEYFVQEGDDLWESADEDLVELARRECEALGLIPANRVRDGVVVRMKKAYPVYDDDYQAAVATMRGWLEGLENLRQVGRNGQHRYNNQDHSMMTGVLAARNLLGEDVDPWSVNVEQEYHEEGAAGAGATGERQVPRRLEGGDLRKLFADTFARYDPVALGTAIALVAGCGLFLATAVLLLANGGNPVGPNLSLLGAYFLGYTVSWSGAVVGGLEAGLLGFGFGWILAHLINAVVSREERLLRERAEADWAMRLVEGDER